MPALICTSVLKAKKKKNSQCFSSSFTLYFCADHVQYVYECVGVSAALVKQTRLSFYELSLWIKALDEYSLLGVNSE